eukprot:m51a1_g12505 hypothetical protein (456) ;mRNA; f:446-2257
MSAGYNDNASTADAPQDDVSPTLTSPSGHSIRTSVGSSVVGGSCPSVHPHASPAVQPQQQQKRPSHIDSLPDITGSSTGVHATRHDLPYGWNLPVALLELLEAPKPLDYIERPDPAVGDAEWRAAQKTCEQKYYGRELTELEWMAQHMSRSSGSLAFSPEPCGTADVDPRRCSFCGCVHADMPVPEALQASVSDDPPGSPQRPATPQGLRPAEEKRWLPCIAPLSAFILRNYYREMTPAERREFYRGPELPSSAPASLSRPPSPSELAEEWDPASLEQSATPTPSPDAGQRPKRQHEESDNDDELDNEPPRSKRRTGDSDDDCAWTEHITTPQATEGQLSDESRWPSPELSSPAPPPWAPSPRVEARAERPHWRRVLLAKWQLEQKAKAVPGEQQEDHEAEPLQEEAEEELPGEEMGAVVWEDDGDAGMEDEGVHMPEQVEDAEAPPPDWEEAVE